VKPRPLRPAAEDYDEPVHIGLVSRLFLWCGAVDRSKLASRAEAYRYANLGLVVCAVATLAAAAFAIFTLTVVGRFTPLIIPAALAWGLIIFAIDRTIVAEPNYRERQAHKLKSKWTETKRRGVSPAKAAVAAPRPQRAGRAAAAAAQK